jgi:hypothetical protein
MIVEILIGMLLMFVIMWVVVNVWNEVTKVQPFDVDEQDLLNDPIFEKIKCPECYSYNYRICYVNPIFKSGRYALCSKCSRAFDLPEDDDGKNWELEVIEEDNSKFVEGIVVDEVEDLPNDYKVIKI